MIVSVFGQVVVVVVYVWVVFMFPVSQLHSCTSQSRAEQSIHINLVITLFYRCIQWADLRKL